MKSKRKGKIWQHTATIHASTNHLYHLLWGEEGGYDSAEKPFSVSTLLEWRWSQAILGVLCGANQLKERPQLWKRSSKKWRMVNVNSIVMRNLIMTRRKRRKNYLLWWWKEIAKRKGKKSKDLTPTTTALLPKKPLLCVYFAANRIG